MLPKPPRAEPPRKPVAMQVVQQRVTGAVDTTVLTVSRRPPKPSSALAASDAGPTSAERSGR